MCEGRSYRQFVVCPSQYDPVGIGEYGAYDVGYLSMGVIVDWGPGDWMILGKVGVIGKRLGISFTWLLHCKTDYVNVGSSTVWTRIVMNCYCEGQGRGGGTLMDACTVTDFQIVRHRLDGGAHITLMIAGCWQFYHVKRPI